MRMIKEQEDKFDVDSDWVMPQLTGLLRDGGRLDQRCASSTTHISTHQALLCDCLESRCGVESGAQRLAGS